MRRFLTALLVSCFLVGSLAMLAQDKKAPAKLTFTAKNGNVTFNHADHAKRAKEDCKVCHDKLWPQSNTAPLGWKGGVMHKTAETAHTSCGACHYASGPAFGAAGNCAKCHVKAG